MNAGSSHPIVWKDGRLHDVARDASLAALCAAIEQAVNAHRAEGTSVRAVILMLDETPAHAATAKAESTPVFVDVYDSGFGHDAGYGHGI